MNVPNFINAFEKDGEELLFAIEVFKMDERILSDVFGLALSDMQTDQIEISSRQAEMLNTMLILNLEPKKFEYYLDCDRRGKLK